MAIYAGVDTYWTSNTNKGRLHAATKGIIQDGLVLNLDAGVLQSYNNSNTWYDLSTTANNGTLINGPVFNSDFGGSLVFDGTNDYVSASASSVFNNFSYDVWCIPNATHQVESQTLSTNGGTAGQRYVIGPRYVPPPDAGSGISVGTNGVSVYEHSASYMPPLLSYAISINSIVNIVVVYIDKTPHLYINGVFIKSGLTSNKANVKITTDLICAYPNYGFFSGKLYSARFYNRVLTIKEIQQNFNTTRKRFGI